MAKARYIINVNTQEIHPWYEPWLGNGGFVEYDPTLHGYRAEVAAQLGLVDPAASVKPAVVLPKAVVSEYVAGDPVTSTPDTTVPEKAQGQTAEPDLSDVFASK